MNSEDSSRGTHLDGVPRDAGAVALVGDSQAHRALCERLQRVAPCDRPVLVVGPTGAGKELAARALHYWSPRALEPVVTVNCGALADGPALDELFGDDLRPGLPEEGSLAAVGAGTLLLDEVSALSKVVQARLIRVLETGRYRTPSGAARLFRGRVVAVTHMDLRELIAEGAFREDLYYRLSAFQVRVPALTARRDDIPLLARHFLRAAGSPLRLSRPAERLLAEFHWPGNVRQLRNVVERLAIFCADCVDSAAVREELRAEALADRPSAVVPSFAARLREIAREVLEMDLDDPLEDMEDALFREALAQTCDLAEAARMLGVHRDVLAPAFARARLEGLVGAEDSLREDVG